MSTITFKQAEQLIKLQDYENIAIEYQKIIDLGVETYWKNIEKQYNNLGFDIDIADERYEDVVMLRTFKYRMELMLLSCLCETWEQDLYNFLKKQKYITSRSNEYNDIKEIFNKAFPSQSIDSEKYKAIREMRSLVNTIKHGNGPSFSKIISLLGDSILANDHLGFNKEDGKEVWVKRRKYDDNTLTSITLNVEGKIKYYYKNIIDFWNDVFQEIQKREVPKR